MFRRTLAALLGGILVLTISGFNAAVAKTGKGVASPEQVRASVLKLGTGKSARVEVRLNDNSSLKGYVSEAGENSFTVVDLKTGQAHQLAYTDVIQVKKKGNGLSSQTKWIIGASTAAGAAIVLYVVRGAFCDGMC